MFFSRPAAPDPPHAHHPASVGVGAWGQDETIWERAASINLNFDGRFANNTICFVPCTIHRFSQVALAPRYIQQYSNASDCDPAMKHNRLELPAGHARYQPRNCSASPCHPGNFSCCPQFGPSALEMLPCPLSTICMA